MTPVLIRTVLGLAAVRRILTPPVVLVPTMGALHDGHRAAIRRARELAGINGSVVVSVFVNPLQFGPAEDLDRYPRPLEADLAICAEEGAAAVFAPSARQMYPVPQTVLVHPGPVGSLLEGEFRPGFFEGVLTVVLKLFHLIGPDVAVFGQKDAQQLALVRAMAVELNLPVSVESVPTHRDPDGLATASRNVYLSAAARASALALPRALRAARSAAAGGPTAALAAASAILDAAKDSDPPVMADYLVLADPASFTPVHGDHVGPALLLVAARVDGTRLIDNIPLSFGGRP